MPDKHPYATSISGLMQLIKHLRSAFPSPLDAEVLKKLGFAPKNESYILYTLRFLGIINDEGNRTERAEKTFTQHMDADFQNEFQKLVKEAYADLFSLHKEAWTIDTDKLITFFRQSDKSSGEVGRRQANTFIALAGIAGLRDIGDQKPAPAKKPAAVTDRPKKGASKRAPDTEAGIASGRSGPGQNRTYGLTVRIEINLPAEGSKETYDKIFKSLKDNLLNE